MKSSSFIAVALAGALGPGAAQAAELDAEALVARVLENNPRLLAARSDVSGAGAAAEAAGGFDDPMISYGVAPFMLAEGNTVNAHQFEVEQRLPWFGKRGLARDMAAADARMLAAQARGTAQELATQARLLVADRARLRVEHDALVEQLTRLEELRRTTLAAIAAGRASQADALMVESEFHMVHEEQLANRGALAKVEAAIDALAGEPVAEQISAEPPVWSAPAAAPRELPEVEAERSAREQAAAAERMVRRDYFPDVTLFAGVNTMFKERAEWVMAGVRLNLPVQRGRRGAEVEAARAKARAAAARLRGAEVARDEMRRTARAERDEAEQRRVLYEETAIPLAERRLAAARAAYAGGRGTIDAVIEALRYDITARSMTTLMQIMSYKAQAELALAEGVALAGVSGGAQ